MIECKGLADLDNLFKSSIARHQDYLDPNHQEGKHPSNFALLTYTLNGTSYYLRGDIKRSAMENYCQVYESSNKKCNLLDPEVLSIKGDKLLIANTEKAEGFYCYKK